MMQVLPILILQVYLLAKFSSILKAGNKHFQEQLIIIQECVELELDIGSTGRQIFRNRIGQLCYIGYVPWNLNCTIFIAGFMRSPVEDIGALGCWPGQFYDQQNTLTCLLLHGCLGTVRDLRTFPFTESLQTLQIPSFMLMNSVLMFSIQGSGLWTGMAMANPLFCAQLSFFFCMCVCVLIMIFALVH